MKLPEWHMKFGKTFGEKLLITERLQAVDVNNTLGRPVDRNLKMFNCLLFRSISNDQLDNV